VAPALEVVGLTKRFGKFTAVDDLSFRVDEGEVFGLLGATGRGNPPRSACSWAALADLGRGACSASTLPGTRKGSSAGSGT